jgi:hypothetical protein
MFGAVTYSNEAEGYTEYLLADEQGIQVTACAKNNVVKLYRIDWIETDSPRNVALYSLVDAIEAFDRIKRESKEQARYEPATWLNNPENW